MSYKQMPRLGSAIASTILSVFSAVSLVGVDKAQAAVLTYNFLGDSRNFVKVDTSSLTQSNEIYFWGGVSEGRLYGYTSEGQEYANLAGATAIFRRQGDFYGVQAAGYYGSIISDYIIPPDEPYGPRFERVSTNGYWQIIGPDFQSYSETWLSLVNYQSYIDDGSIVIERSARMGRSRQSYNITYTLVKTETVPEPLTAGGTALALAGLSWLKHKKKMAA
jgi:hypothetical protein